MGVGTFDRASSKFPKTRGTGIGARVAISGEHERKAPGGTRPGLAQVGHMSIRAIVTSLAAASLLAAVAGCTAETNAPDADAVDESTEQGVSLLPPGFLATDGTLAVGGKGPVMNLIAVPI